MAIVNNNNNITYNLSSQDKEYSFSTTLEKLLQYPENLFLKIIQFNGTKDIFPDGNIKTPLSVSSLQLVEKFFVTGKWPNPYIKSSQRLSIHGENYNFEESCDFLGLPFDAFEDLEDNEENEQTDEFSFEDDFYPYELDEYDEGVEDWFDKNQIDNLCNDYFEIICNRDYEDYRELQKSNGILRKIFQIKKNNPNLEKYYPDKDCAKIIDKGIKKLNLK